MVVYLYNYFIAIIILLGFFALILYGIYWDNLNNKHYSTTGCTGCTCYNDDNMMFINDYNTNDDNKDNNIESSSTEENSS